MLGWLAQRNQILLMLGILILPRLALSATAPIVVLDPGHGGSDRGAVHASSPHELLEKDLTLLLAQSIAEALRKRGVDTILTRDRDVDLALEERTALANQIRAKAFVSIHMNSLPPEKGKTRGGFETYILNHTTDQTSQRLAKMENAVLKGSIAEIPNDSGDVPLIVKDLLLDASRARSQELACLVQSSVVRASRQPHRSASHNRGVRQALFYVLLGADMPSILLEAGFINHDSDRELILKDASRAQMAEAIASALDRFLRRTPTPSARAAILDKCFLGKG